MTVQELTDKLREHDPSLPVICEGGRVPTYKIGDVVGGWIVLGGFTREERVVERQGGGKPCVLIVRKEDVRKEN